MDTASRYYLFVCAASRNRSPTAAEVFRALAARAGFPVEASSAGLSPYAERPVTQELADRADLIFVMEDYMAQELETRARRSAVARKDCHLIPITRENFVAGWQWQAAAGR